MLAGATRFIIEFIRVNTRVLGPLTVAHVLSFMLIVIGAVVVYRTRSSWTKAFRARE
jgi:prolipoprotein diacylglyceryltransferase